MGTREEREKKEKRAKSYEELFTKNIAFSNMKMKVLEVRPAQ